MIDRPATAAREMAVVTGTRTGYGKGDELDNEGGQYTRRDFLKIAGIAGAAVSVGGGLGGLLAACGQDTTALQSTSTAAAAGSTSPTAAETTSSAAETTTIVTAGAEGGRELKIGVVHPQTGPLAALATCDQWWMDHGAEALKDGVVCGDGKNHAVKIIGRDTQSDSNRAATITADLIQNDSVDVVLSGGSPDTVNPSADTCEALGCPSISTSCPWQAFYFNRKPPAEGFKWTYGCLIGSEITIANFMDMFNQVPNNKTMGLLFANDADAAAWTAPTGATSVLKANGYNLVIPDFYPPGAEDYTAQIAEFKKEGCDILSGVNSPPDFTNFWKQSYQQGFQPKLASTAKALMLPETLEAIGSIGYGLIGEAAWHPTFPYKDTLTGMTCQQLADGYEAKTGHQWNVSIGTYAMFEWAIDAFKRAKNPEDKESMIEAVRTANNTFVNGPVNMTSPVDPESMHPVPNVYKAVTAGGQWIKGQKHPFDIVVCSAVTAPDVAVQAKVAPISY